MERVRLAQMGERGIYKRAPGRPRLDYLPEKDRPRTLHREKNLVIEKPAADPPFEMGDVLFIREPWYRLKNPTTGEPSGRFTYASDASAEPVGYRWASPVSMPSEAIRLYARVVGLTEKAETKGEEVVQSWELKLELIDKRLAESGDEGLPAEPTDTEKEELTKEAFAALAEIELAERKREIEPRLDEIASRLEAIADILESPDQFTSDAIEEVETERAELYEELELLKQEISGHAEPPDEKNAPFTLGACRYCGQAATVGPHSSQTAADDTASEACSCSDARRERSVGELVDEALDRVDQLFGEPAEELGLTPLAENGSIELLGRVVELIARRAISSATIQVRGACRAKLAFTTKGKIKVTRSETRSYDLEAGE